MGKTYNPSVAVGAGGAQKGTPMRKLRVRHVLPLLLTAGLLGIDGGANADVIYFKDGYAIHGTKTARQMTVIADENGNMVPIPQANGFYFLIDGPRFTIFPDSAKQIKDVDESVNIRADFVSFRSQFIAGERKVLPKSGSMKPVPEFNDKWQRELSMIEPTPDANIEHHIKQQVTVLNPYYVRIDSTNYLWTTYFLTREVGPERLRKMLATHKDLIETDGKPDWKKRKEIFRYMLQANFFDSAEKELDDAVKKCPGDKDAIEDSRKVLNMARAELILDEAERARLGGRHKLAQDYSDRIPADLLDAKLLLRLNAIKGRYAEGTAKLELAQKYLSDLTEAAKGCSQQLQEAVTAVKAELTLDSIDRLDTFITLAGQALKNKAANKTPMQKDEELLAYAVTGWLKGKEGAEGKVEFAERLWRARQLVLNYQNTVSGSDRRKMLSDYMSSKPLAVDEMAQLVTLLPPPDPEAKISDKPVARTTPKAPGFANGVPYTLLLPPEYQHNRAYPVLIAVHNAGERPKDMIDKFGDLAARNGYILAAPEWNGALKPQYEYTAEEHSAVKATLKDLKKHFNVDCDRVFMTGFGEGATLALDVGLSHPDLFAGVAPICAMPRRSVFLEYWRNAQNLPFYFVLGEQSGKMAEETRRLFVEWMPRGYPALEVMYRGRGVDWFDGELPFIFDWMSRKKRANPILDLGVEISGAMGQQYRSQRSTDNHFYWLTSDEMDMRFLTLDVPKEGTGNISKAAHFQASIREGNNVIVRTLGLKAVTVWFAPGMVNFDKPVTIRANNQMWNNKGKPIQPSMSVLLEDLYMRGDRARPFVARVDLQNVDK
jgi:dienelactone hydrolase